MSRACACTDPECLLKGCRLQRDEFSRLVRNNQTATLPPQMPAQTGWICPKCRAVHAPFIPSCQNCAPKIDYLKGATA